MSHYHQLTAFDRGRIEVLLKEGLSMRRIAKEIGRSVSTISREIARSVGSTYVAENANQNHILARTNSHKHRNLDNDELRNVVIYGINQKHWSPEQIAGRLKVSTGHSIISANTIYRAIYRNNLGQSVKNHGARGIARALRHRGKTRHTKGYIERRGKIKIPNTIDERPAEAASRSRIGDWELDTVVGRKGGQVLVTMVDRKTRILFSKRAESKKTADVMRTIGSILNSLPTSQIQTLTPDRGNEFSAQDEITNKFNVQFYFPDPHAPWQRGTNENTNGLIREYVPKGTAIEDYSDEYIERMVEQINSRPRKLFGWRSAKEYYLSQVFRLN